MLPLPPKLAQTIVALYGAQGQAWLDALPALLLSCSRRWGLRFGPPFPSLSFNYAAPAVRFDGAEVVLKAGVPNKELTTEIEALQRFDGRGAVRLLEADAALGLLLMERVRPGIRLLDAADDEQATLAAATVMGRLWRPVSQPGPFPSVGDWGRGFERLRRAFGGGTGPFPAAIVDAGEMVFGELTASMGEPGLLHGDLHHENILLDDTLGWLAIDPKGVVGEREYETGAFLRNPHPALAARRDFERRTSRRLDQLSEVLGFDRRRILGWAFAQAVLSAWWACEDGSPDLKSSLGLAQRFHALWARSRLSS